MKPQDIVFVVLLIVLLFFRNSRLLVVSGVVCFLVSAPLFYLQVFFTAQRLIAYGVGFIFIGIILMLNEQRKNK